MPQSRASLAMEMPGRLQASISSCLACASYTHRPSRLRLTISRPAVSVWPSHLDGDQRSDPR
jgi:hypothetical protein